MDIVYMGLFESIFNWVFDKILSPVFKFIANLLESVLGWLFENVLMPLLINVLWPLFEALVEMVVEILAEIIYGVYAGCLELIDAMQSAFDVFSGLTNVTYKGVSASLLQTLFQLDMIQKTILLITAISLALTMLFAILGTARSAFDLEVQRPVSKVLTMTFQAMVKLFLIPIVCLFAIMMSGKILSGINTAFNSDNVTLARMVFVISSLDASKTAEYNISGKVDDDDDPVKPSESIGINDEIRRPFYKGEKEYSDVEVVKKSFDLARFDYLIGFGGCVFLVLILAVCLFTFISRIIEVLLLFIVSPFFVSVMPLDDGAKFKAWQEMFVAKLFGGYGTVVAMQLYMMLCPIVMDGSIVFGKGTAEANYLLRFLFLLGGAWATIKTGPMVTQILSAQAGHSEMMTGATAMGAVSATASIAKSAAGGLLNKMTSSSPKEEGKQTYLDKNGEPTAGDKKRADAMNSGLGGSGGSAGDGAANPTPSASEGPELGGAGGNEAAAPTPSASEGSEPGGAGGESSGDEAANPTPSASEGSEPGGAGGESSGDEAANPTPSASEGSEPGGTGGESSGDEAANPTPSASEGSEPGGAGGENSGDEAANPTPSASTGSGAGGADGAGAAKPKQKAYHKVRSFFGGRFNVLTKADGSHSIGLDFGKAFQIGRDSKGRFNFRIFGMGTSGDKVNGKANKISLPFVRLKRDKDGSWRCAAVKLPFGFKWKRAETVSKDKNGNTVRTLGDFYFSKMSMIGLKRKYDQDTGKVETQSVMGAHYQKNAYGEYDMTSYNLLGMHFKTNNTYIDAGDDGQENGS